jgi:hypothetical protein
MDPAETVAREMMGVFIHFIKHPDLHLAMECGNNLCFFTSVSGNKIHFAK